MTVRLPDESNAHQLQEQYQKILASLIDKISAAVKEARRKSQAKQEPSIRIFISGKEVLKDKLTPPQIEKLRQAIESPNQLKGSVRVKDDKELLLDVKDGQVKVDKLGLVQTQKQEIKTEKTIDSEKTTQTELPQKPQSTTQAYSQNPNSPPIAEVASLKQTVEQQVQKIEALEQKLDALSQSISSIQDKSLSRWMGNTLSSTAKGFKQAVAGWAISKNNAVKNLRSAFTTQHPLQKNLQEIENKVQAVNTKFDWGMENIQAHLNVIQQQIKDIQNNPVVQSTTKAVVGKVIEPAVASVLQGTGVMQNFEKLQAKEGLAKQEGTTERVESIPNAHKEFKAGMVVAAAEKLLDRISAHTPDGNRSFQTGSGYMFEKKGDTITISNPDRSELVRSVGKGSERTINVSKSLTAQKAANLEQIGEKIHQDLSPTQTQSQNLGVTQGARRQ